MAQYQNEYEGIGNSLMNIGAMYYSQSEKRKEEERLRKEKMDDRKYLEEQADKEYARKAPLEVLNQELKRIQIENAKLTGQKTLVDTYRPQVDTLGNVARTTVPTFEGGKLSYESTDETISPLNPYQPREPRSPYTKVGNQIIDTRTMQPAYTAPAAASKASGVTPSSLMGQEIKIAGAQAKLDAMSDFDIRKSGTTREAMQKGIDAQKAVLSRYAAPATAPLTKQESADSSTSANGVKMTAGGTPAEKAAFAKWTKAYEEAIAIGATKEEAEILANEAAGE